MRKIRTVVVFFIMILSLAVYGFSQEEPSLIKQTLDMDIKTADYYELIAWCEKLGLSQKGGIPELRERLYEYYNVSPEEAPPEEGEKRTITITSARTTDYFTIEKIDENYVKLEGDVILEMRDPETDTVHKIEAQKILLNETEELVTATGDITYTITEKGSEETFRGKSLSFNVESLEGVFFEGISETERLIEEESITFYYSGKEMYRSPEDIITLSEGSITSSKLEDPYYQIKASKIWVMEPGEWGLRDATLYVGRVPMLYVPFFFYIGDELFFHPSLGYRDIEGNYFQTTTYVFGKKQDKQSSLSFLQTEEEDGEYKREVRGLFLKKTRPMTQEEKEEYEYIESSGSFVKIMLDLYHRLGLFAGVRGKIADVDPLKAWKFYLAVARSRSILIDPETDQFIPYWYKGDEVISYWNSSYFVGFELPLRYGLSNELNLNHPVFTLDGLIEIYSDPYFLRDFNRREENINWARMIGFEEEESEAEGTVMSSYIKDTLDWNIDGSLSLKTEPIEPFVETLSVKELSTNMYWKSEEADTEGIAGLDQDVPGYVPEEHRSPMSFPLKRYYYPESYLLPSASVEIGGTFFDVSYGEKPQKSGQQEQEDGKIIPPWETDSDDTPEEKDQEQDDEYVLPPLREDISLPQEPDYTPFQHSLSYQILPEASLNNRMNSDEWNSPEDIDFSREYSIANTKGGTKLTYSTNIFERYLTITDSIGLKGEYQNHFNRNDISDETWEEYLTTDYSTTFLNVNNAVTATTHPLLSSSALEKSSLSYTLDTVLFEKEFKEVDLHMNPVFVDNIIQWEKDYVNKHSISSSLVLSSFRQDQSLAVTTVFPPLDMDITATLTLNTGPATHIWSGGAKETEDEANKQNTNWEPKPLTITEQLKISNYLFLEQYFSHNFVQSRWDKSRSTARLTFLDKNITLEEVFVFGDPAFADDGEGEAAPPLFEDPFSSRTSLSLWWFYLDFSAQKVASSTFDPVTGWESTENKLFQPESLTLGIDLANEGEPVWKNRIRLGVDIDTAVTMNLIKFTDSLLSFDLIVNFVVHKFLDLSFRFRSENNDIYRYFPEYTAITGETTLNPFIDLGKSFNFFNRKDRLASRFNAEEISLSAVHHLHDWDLTVEYNAKPELQTTEAGYKEYSWDQSFSIFVQWNPIPELTGEVTYSDEEIQF